MKNKINYIARILVGCLFIFSGAIKINDPVGTSIKLHEYFDVFSNDIASFFQVFVPMALVIAVILSVMEVALGFALLVNWKMKITSWVTLILMTFFTFLTFYSAYFNKVTDCGCFGDAIKLTPWESFTKDIILMVLIVPIFILRRESEGRMKKANSNLIVGISTLLSLVFAITAIMYLPFKDFRAYKIGVNIQTAMQPSEPLEYLYVLEKDGKQEEFKEYPTDPDYKFIKMDVMNPEAQPKITDFAIWNDDGDFTEKLFEGKKLLIILYNVEKAKRKFKNINTLVAACEQKGIEPWVLTASSAEQFEEFRHEVQLAAPYYFADATVLKTMIRSNPGLMLLKDGTILGKWHVNATPDIDEINELL